MKHGNFCHYCNHYIGGHGLWAGGDGGSGTGLYAGGNGPPRGGSLKSIGKAFKSGNIGKIFSPSANKSTASTLIHQGIPLAGEAAGVALGEPLGPAGYIAGGLAGHQVGDAVADEVGKATGYGMKRRGVQHAGDVAQDDFDDATGFGLKPNQPYLTGKGASSWIAHVKAYAQQHGLKYGQALKHAKESYHAGKASAKGSKKNKAMGAISGFLSGANTGGKQKRSAGAWVAHVKAYASQHGLPYKHAMSLARESYHSGKKDPQSTKERFTAEVMHRMNAVPDEEKAKVASSPFGMGLRYGTEKHVQFHRNKLKKMHGQLADLEDIGMQGTTVHRRLKRNISKREAIIERALDAPAYQHKTYQPVAEDGRKKSKWIHHVKGFANYHGMSYKAAMSHPDSKSAYQSGDYYTMDRPRQKKTRERRAEPVVEPAVQSRYSLRSSKGKGLKAYVASLPFV